MGIIRFFAILLFAYLTWRDLRDNYEENSVVSYCWMALLLFFISGRITYGLVNYGIWNDNWSSWFSIWQKPGISYVGAFGGLLLANFIFSKIKNWKFVPFCEDNLKNALLLLFFLLLDELVRSNFDLKVGSYLIFLVLTLIYMNIAKIKYRSLVWYKSGKKGFAFLSTLFLSFLILGFIEIAFHSNIFFSIIYWIISLISLTGLCILGEVFNFLSINKRR